MFQKYERNAHAAKQTDSMQTDIRERNRIEIVRLVNQAKNGSHHALEKLIARLQPLIYSTIRRHAAGPDWEDLLQEAALVILEGIRDYNETTGIPFLAYIKIKLNFHIYNLCRRQRKKEFYNNSFYNISPESNEVDPMDLIVDETNDTLGYVLKREQAAAVKEALESLDLKHRQVIILYHFKKLSLREIAKKLGVSYRTAQRYKAKAEERMAGLLGE
ncbi:MAG TPA: sigma-70 family RNA polymerase sigma factor [Clostridiales bacterium]|nr:sigma-70 family RNA polymerase sigma factor [Clostridiales bacterium]